MFLLVRLSLLLLLSVLLVVRVTKANEKCEKNVSAASLPMPAALLPVSLLLRPRVAKLSGDKKYENFDAATRFRFASKLFRSAQPVSVAAYYCVFVPTVAARCRSSTQRAAHSSQLTRTHTTLSSLSFCLPLSRCLALAEQQRHRRQPTTRVYCALACTHATRLCFVLCCSLTHSRALACAVLSQHAANGGALS